MARLFSILGDGSPRRVFPRPIRLRLEVLESRRLLTAFTWSAPAETGLPSSLSNVAAVLASDHSILLLGANSSAVYDQAYGSSTWTSVNSLVSPVYPVTVNSPGFGSIGGGKFLVYGNLSVQLPDDPTNISALQYDPVNAANIAAASAMSTPRTQFAYATDGSNDAYAIGGVAVGTSTLLSTVERYNPASGTWSYLGALPQPISGAAAAYDGNGHIFVFGGVTGTTTSTATLTGNVEEYTIATDTWSTLSQQMSTAATQAAAVHGPDGMIYVLGGKGTSNSALANVQVYNPAQNTWSQGTALPHSLYNEAAVIDASGEINVIGQYSSNGNPVQVVYVSQVLANVAPSFTTTSLPAAMAGNPYTAMVTVTATPPATISVQSGPTGLNIDSNTGTLTWTPPEGLANTQQSVTIQATNPYGTATETISIAVTPDTTIPTTPSYPSVVTANLTTSSIPLTWNASTDGDGVAGYTVYAYTPPVGHSGRGGGITKPAVYKPIATGITTTSYTVTGLSPGTSYQYAVAAYDPAGNVSGYSNVVTGTTLSATTIIYYLDGVYIDPATFGRRQPPVVFHAIRPRKPDANANHVLGPQRRRFWGRPVWRQHHLDPDRRPGRSERHHHAIDQHRGHHDDGYPGDGDTRPARPFPEHQRRLRLRCGQHDSRGRKPLPISVGGEPRLQQRQPRRPHAAVRDGGDPVYIPVFGHEQHEPDHLRPRLRAGQHDA